MESPSKIFRSNEQIQQHLSRFSESGMSVKGYCHEEGIAYSSFQNWRRRNGLVRSRTSYAKDAGFARISLSDFNSHIQLRFPDGFIISAPSSTPWEVLTRLIKACRK